MTKEQFGLCAQWWHEGRLMLDGKHTSVLPMPTTSDFGRYSRREDPPKPTMPDEIWITRSEDIPTVFDATLKKYNSESVRYIRADEIIDGKRMEFRTKGRDTWTIASGWEYRFKP